MRTNDWNTCEVNTMDNEARKKLEKKVFGDVVLALNEKDYNYSVNRGQTVDIGWGEGDDRVEMRIWASGRVLRYSCYIGDAGDEINRPRLLQSINEVNNDLSLGKIVLNEERNYIEYLLDCPFGENTPDSGMILGMVNRAYDVTRENMGRLRADATQVKEAEARDRMFS